MKWAPRIGNKLYELIKRPNVLIEPTGTLTQKVVMYYASSVVTYTFVYTDSEPERVFWGADEELPPRAIKQTGPVTTGRGCSREPISYKPHDPDYVPEPINPEYIPLEDEHEFSVKEQPFPPLDSPTAESPGYVTESDPEEDPEEYQE
ncbi:hypothetical protein Tco_0716276 [Tanacetum coccineum]